MAGGRGRRSWSRRMLEMGQWEDDEYQFCPWCGVSFDVHSVISPDCEEADREPLPADLVEEDV